MKDPGLGPKELPAKEKQMETEWNIIWPVAVYRRFRPSRVILGLVYSLRSRDEVKSECEDSVVFCVWDRALNAQRAVKYKMTDFPT